MMEEFGSTKSVDDDGEPRVTSDDPNERIMARRLRIQRRQLELRRKLDYEQEGETVTSLQEISDVQQQIRSSYELIEKMLIEGEEWCVGNVVAATEAREVDRRESEGIGREKVIQLLEDESRKAQEMFEGIAERWSTILRNNDPLGINDELLGQKQRCDEIIKQKDGVIAMLREELKKAETTFNDDQKEQESDINILTQRIEKQVTLMRRAFRNELDLIENAISLERHQLVESNYRKWEELHRKRDIEEQSSSDKKFQQIDEFNEMMIKTRQQCEEKFRAIKIKLEGDISEIQMELERIKAQALMNREKLDYNFQILKKREDENIIIKSQQKRRINKLQDIINSLKSKISDLQKHHVSQVDKLSEEIRKLHRSIMDVEAKADHFAKVNNDKYCQIWDLNEKRAKEMLKKIFDTDKLLHEQQLGLVWEKPMQNYIMKIDDLESYQKAVSLVRADEAVQRKLVGTEDKQESVESKHDLKTITANDTPAYKRLLKHILNQITNKTGFLIEDRLKVILKPYSVNDQTLVRIDHVFSALNIKDLTDQDLLVKAFLPYAFCPICSKHKEELVKEQSITDQHLDQESEIKIPAIDTRAIIEAVQQPDAVIRDIVTTFDKDCEDVFALTTSPSTEECAERMSIEPSSIAEEAGAVSINKKDAEPDERMHCQFHHPLTIATVYALKALKDFIASHHETKEGLLTMEFRLNRKRNTISRLIDEGDVSLFWEKFKEAYSKEMEQLWTGCFEGLKKYHDILKDRRMLSEDVVRLRDENIKLRTILRRYKMIEGED